MTGNTQAVTCSVQYDPWGNPISGQGTGNPCKSGSTSGDVFYRSARRDASTGNYQFGYRTYDPTKAGFLSSDVYRAGSPGQNQGLQLDPLTAARYNYVNGDPVNLVDFNGHKRCGQGDPNPDCDAYGPGTYQGWKDRAYYDNQANQRAMAHQQAAERYKAWPEQQKRDAAKHKNDCSWNPFDKNSCEARGVSTAWHATEQCFGGPEHTCVKIAAEVAVGFVVGAACEAATAGAGSIGCLMLAGAASGAVGGMLECKSGQSMGNCALRGAAMGAASGLVGGALGRVAVKVGGALLSRTFSNVADGARGAVEQTAIHGNSLASPRLTSLYRLNDSDGSLLKWGITSEPNPLPRYSQDFMKNKSMDTIATGSRAEMAAMERVLTERVPGPLNLESWAGSEFGNDMGVIETILGGA